MKPSCKNCINPECPYAVQGIWECDYDKTGLKRFVCDSHTNFFGNAKITSVETINFSKMDNEALEDWALSDGFGSWMSAAKWFSAVYSKKLKSWRTEDWDVIKWEPGSNWVTEVA
jgi:hypothetical protein